MGWHGSKTGKKGHGSTGHGAYPGSRHGGLSSLMGSLGPDRKNSRHDDDRRDDEDRDSYHGDTGYSDGRRYDEGHSGQPAWGRKGYGRGGKDALPGWVSSDSAPGPIVQSKFVFVGAIGAVLLWSLLAWAAYELIDGLGGWLSTNTGALLQGGKDAIGTIGIGKDVVDQVNVQGTSGLLQQLIASAVVVARPAIVFVWFLGSLAILAMPFILRRLGGFARSRRH